MSSGLPRLGVTFNTTASQPCTPRACSAGKQSMGILSESQSLSQVTVQISVDCIWSHLNASVAACPCVKLGLTWFLLGLTIHACESSSLHMSCVIGVDNRSCAVATCASRLHGSADSQKSTLMYRSVAKYCGNKQCHIDPKESGHYGSAVSAAHHHMGIHSFSK